MSSSILQRVELHPVPLLHTLTPIIYYSSAILLSDWYVSYAFIFDETSPTHSLYLIRSFSVRLWMFSLSWLCTTVGGVALHHDRLDRNIVDQLNCISHLQAKPLMSCMAAFNGFQTVDFSFWQYSIWNSSETALKQFVSFMILGADIYVLPVMVMIPWTCHLAPGSVSNVLT